MDRLKGGVGLLRGGEDRRLDHPCRPLSLVGQVPHFAHRHAQIVRNRLCDGGGLLQNRIQLFAPQNAGTHSLRKLEHGGLRPLCAGTRQGELLVDLLGKGHHLRRAAEGVSRQGPQLGHKVRRVLIIAPGPLCGLVDHILDLRRSLLAVVHPLQPGGGLGPGVGQVHKLLRTAEAQISRRQVPEFAKQPIGGAGAVPKTAVEPFLGSRRAVGAVPERVHILPHPL